MSLCPKCGESKNIDYCEYCEVSLCLCGLDQHDRCYEQKRANPSRGGAQVVKMGPCAVVALATLSATGLAGWGLIEAICHIL